MDKGTFDTVARISEEMKSLKAINERINKASLSFIGDDYYDAISLYKWKKVIQDILSKHEAEYYINPKGVIDYVYEHEYSPDYLLVKEFYKKIELSEIKKWKPKYNEYYYRITWIGEVAEDIWYGSRNDESGYEFGNCFKTIKEAESVRDKIKEILNKHK